jgi:hypothetical protein
VILVNRKLNVGNYKNLVSTQASGRIQRALSVTRVKQNPPCIEA